MRPVIRQPLPLNKPLYYNAENQHFRYVYENGGLMVEGNNLNMASIPLEDVVLHLYWEVEDLKRELAALKEVKK